MVSHADAGSTMKRSEPPARIPRVRVNRARTSRWVVLLLAIAAGFALLPLWAPLALAAWTAILARPLYERLGRSFRAKRAAGMLTVVLVILALAPVVTVGLSLAGEAVHLVDRLVRSGSSQAALQALGTDEPGIQFNKLDLRQAIDLARRHGVGAMSAARSLFGAATAAVVGTVIFAYGFHTFLVDGRRIHQWLLERSPIPRAQFIRLGDAFVETGRGLIIGVGLTALLQGSVATLGYVALGVPQALVLGLLTVLASLIPSVGSGLVWVPVTILLFVQGRTGAAAIMLAIGLVVSVVDNFVRPVLSRYGKLQLPTFLLFVSMLGGIAAFGGLGLILGPLFVRLAVEALDMLKEQPARVTA